MNWVPNPLLKAYRRAKYKRHLGLGSWASDEEMWHACLENAYRETAQALVAAGLIPRGRDGSDTRQKMLHAWLFSLVTHAPNAMGPKMGLLPEILSTGADPYVRPCWSGTPPSDTAPDRRSFLDRLVDEAPGRTLLQVLKTQALRLDGTAADGTPYVFKVLDRTGNPLLNWEVVEHLLQQGLSVNQSDRYGANLITRAFQEGPAPFNLIKRWSERMAAGHQERDIWRQGRELKLLLPEWVGQTQARWNTQREWAKATMSEPPAYDIGSMIRDAFYFCGKSCEGRDIQGRTFVQAWIHGGAWSMENLQFMLDPAAHEALIWPAWRARDEAGNTYWHTLFSRADIWDDRKADTSVTQRLVDHLKVEIPNFLDERNSAGQTPHEVFEQQREHWPETAVQRAMVFWREHHGNQAAPTRPALRPRLRP